MVIARVVRAPILALVLALAAVAAGPAAAQRSPPGIKTVSLSALAARGFEIKAGLRDALILQKGAEVYWCVLHLANTSPLSYQSACYAVR